MMRSFANACTHEAQRAMDRKALAKYRPYALALAEAFPPGHYAVKLGDVGFQGVPWSDESNGSVAVAIIRDNRVVTLMFRRTTQPWTAEALSVDRCVP